MIKTTFQQLAKWVNGTLINTVENSEVVGVSINTREMNHAQIFIPIVGERFDGHQYVDAAFSQGALISLFNRQLDYSKFKSPLILVEDTKKALALLAKNYLASIDCQVIGITGSNGKTSTKDIVSSLLKSSYRLIKTQGNRNNEIGLPLTILEMPQETEIAVLEMGMSALNEIDYLSWIAPCDIAIITSIGKAHLVELKTEENIVKAKLEIINHLKDNGVLIYNGDHPLLKQKVLALGNNIQSISYGFKSDNDYCIESVSQFMDSILFTVDNLMSQPIEANILGQFQALNVTAALIAAKRFISDERLLQQQLKSIDLTQKRNEITMIQQAVIIDDSYKSNPESLMAACQLLSDYQNNGIKVAVLGDMLDLGEKEIFYHQHVGQQLASLNIDRLYTYGDLSRYFHDHNAIIGEHFQSKADLVKVLQPWIHQSSTILFKASNALSLWQVIDELKKENVK